MQINITAQPVFHIPLTEKHLATLIILSRHHYDAHCKLAASDNGFLTRWSRMIEADTAADLDVVPLRASFDELDTCLKLLEMRHIAARTLLDGVQAELCYVMNKTFSGATRLANSKYNEWQTVYEAQV